MYLCLSQQRLKDTSHFELIPLRKEDIEPIRLWRNAQLEVLRQNTPLSKEEQEAYYKTTITPLFSLTEPSQILFSFLKEEICIGYGGLTHIDWTSKRAEVSFLLDPKLALDEALYEEAFTHFLKLLEKIAFTDLHLHRLFTETYHFRTIHIKALEHAGFKLEGRMRHHVYKRGKWIDSLIHASVSEEVL